MKSNKSNINKNNETLTLKKNSIWIIISFSLGQFLWNLVNGVFGSQIQFFYENEVLLEIWLYALAFIIYTVWNMINDPIIGYLCDKSTRFTKKWGKRFPWIMMFGIPWCISLIFVYLSASVMEWGQLFVFIWLLIFICLFDTLLSVWNINWIGLTPDKFRDDIERKKIGAYGSILGTMGALFALILPPLIARYGDRNSYILMAIITAIIGIISFILMIPGSFEDKEMRERRIEIDLKHKEPFLKVFKEAVKQKNFMAYCIIYLLWQTSSQIITVSLPYWNSWILGLPKRYEMLPALFYVITSLASIPFWYRLSIKYGCQKIGMIGFIICGVPLLLALFFSSLLLTIIVFAIFGLGIGAFWTVMTAIIGDVLDEITLKTKKRDEGTYIGIRTFIARLAIGIQVLLFAIIHSLTNYIPGDPSKITQPPEALLGIRILIGLIPGILFLLAAYIFWKIYDLTPEKTNSIKHELYKLKL